jgi:hypothetical protein
MVRGRPDDDIANLRQARVGAQALVGNDLYREEASHDQRVRPGPNSHKVIAARK